MTPKPESETDPWAKVTPAMLAVLRTIENGEHEIVDCPVCQGVDALEALMAYVYTARAAEAAQHRQALVDARRAEHTVWKGRAEAADARLAAVEAERDKAVAEVCAFSREQGIEAAQEIAAKDETIARQARSIKALYEAEDWRATALLEEIALRTAVEAELQDVRRALDAKDRDTSTRDLLNAAGRRQFDMRVAVEAERDRLKAALQGLQSDIEHDAHVNQPEAFRNYWRGRLHSEIAALTPQGQSTDGETR